MKDELAKYGSYFYGSEQEKFVIIAPEKTIPETLFHYVRFSERSVQNIVNNRLFASQPDSFNDLFDSNPNLIDIKNVEWKQIENFYSILPNAKEEFNKNRETFLNSFHHTFYHFFVSRLGILCTTGSYKNDLFWSYYNNHEGLCLEFDYKKFGSNFYGPFPMNYINENEIKKIDFSKYSGLATVLILTNIKKAFWSHENEFRFIIIPKENGEFITEGRYNNEANPYPRSSRIVDLPSNTLKSIMFGFRFIKYDDIISEYKNEVIISFKSQDNELRNQLFEYIIENEIDTYEIVYDKDFQLKRRKLLINKIDKYRFKVIKLDVE